jgi:hypothetical protein
MVEVLPYKTLDKTTLDKVRDVLSSESATQFLPLPEGEGRGLSRRSFGAKADEGEGHKIKLKASAQLTPP